MRTLRRRHPGVPVRASVVPCVAALVVLVGACGGQSSRATLTAGRAQGPPDTATTVVTTPRGAPKVTSNTAPAPAPDPEAVRSRATVDPQFDYGSDVYLGERAPRPRWLVAPLGGTVVFHNDGSTSRSVVLTNTSDAEGRPIASGAIAPGGQWAYAADGFASITYRVEGGERSIEGQVQILPPANP